MIGAKESRVTVGEEWWVCMGADMICREGVAMVATIEADVVGVLLSFDTML